MRKRLDTARAEGVAEAEARLRHGYEEQIRAESQRITRAIDEFERSRKEYFSKVELEVVQLALAIAGKILHREAQVDPLLVAAIVQIALGQLKEGSVASIRVRPEDGQRWRSHFASQDFKLDVSVVEDRTLQPADCILETELGTVNFSLNLQLKEIEQGFFDVLAQKPQA
ncbi:FliH/SctL family protein [Granulicella sibirica]|uniref:FliH/SctL family protein n=1 Tax=Granulicella sibirica TaxID=2479048 RepID=UPI001F4F8FE4|nr:FliH/SctL family protein [Granulicella sibirica]